jgi:hypothetical protein
MTSVTPHQFLEPICTEERFPFDQPAGSFSVTAQSGRGGSRPPAGRLHCMAERTAALGSGRE